MPSKNKAAKDAAFAMKQELDSEVRAQKRIKKGKRRACSSHHSFLLLRGRQMTEEERQRIEKSGMGVGKAGLNTGEEKLFGAPRAFSSAALSPSLSLTRVGRCHRSQEADQGGEEGGGRA